MRSSSRPDPLLELAQIFYNTPLLIEKGRLDAILATPVDRATVDPSAFFFLFEEPESEDFDLRDGVAVIDIHRSMLRPRTYQVIRQRIAAALGSQSVRAILLDIDSPGGSITGFFDLVDWIHDARGEKPIWAVANDRAFSAAYGIASAADRVFVTRTGGVGSVGVLAVHVEYSEMDKRMGVKFTPVFSGARKNDFADTEPLNATARAALQAECDRLREIFVEAVARNRGVEAEAIRDTEADVYFGPNGVGLLADGEQSFDEVFDALRREVTGTNGAQAGTPGAPTKESAMSDQDKTKQDKTATAEAAAGDAAAAPAAGAEVVDLDTARAEGERVGLKRSAERTSAIRLACDLAGRPERFGEFLDGDMTPEAVGKQLLEEAAAASGPEVNGRHAGDGSDPEPTLDTAAIYKRWNDPAAFAGTTPTS